MLESDVIQPRGATAKWRILLNCTEKRKGTHPPRPSQKRMYGAYLCDRLDFRLLYDSKADRLRLVCFVTLTCYRILVDVTFSTKIGNTEPKLRARQT